MASPTPQPVLRLRTSWSRSARFKSRQGGASAEARQTLSSTQGKEALEKKPNNGVQSQEVPE